MREYRYRVDGEGRVFHAGSEIVDAPVLRFFLRAMTREPDGRWLVLCQGERNWFEVEDTPFVVQRVRPAPVADPAAAGDPPGIATGLELVLAGDHREPLDPGTLETDGGRLYCRVRRGAFPARFGRRAIQQLAPVLVEDGAGLGLVLGGIRHPIREPGPPGAAVGRTAAARARLVPSSGRAPAP